MIFLNRLLTNQSIDKASEAFIEDVYVDYPWLKRGNDGSKTPGVVKIGMDVVVSQGYVKASTARPDLNQKFVFTPVSTTDGCGWPDPKLETPVVSFHFARTTGFKYETK